MFQFLRESAQKRGEVIKVCSVRTIPELSEPLESSDLTESIKKLEIYQLSDKFENPEGFCS